MALEILCRMLNGETLRMSPSDQSSIKSWIHRTPYEEETREMIPKSLINL